MGKCIMHPGSLRKEPGICVIRTLNPGYSLLTIIGKMCKLPVTSLVYWLKSTLIPEQFIPGFAGRRLPYEPNNSKRTELQLSALADCLNPLSTKRMDEIFASPGRLLYLAKVVQRKRRLLSFIQTFGLFLPSGIGRLLSDLSLLDADNHRNNHALWTLALCDRYLPLPPLHPLSVQLTKQERMASKVQVLSSGVYLSLFPYVLHDPSDCPSPPRRRMTLILAYIFIRASATSSAGVIPAKIMAAP